MSNMPQLRPIFDHLEIKAIIAGRKIVSPTRMKRLLALCLQKIDELQATVDELMEEEEEYEIRHASLLDEGYIND